MTFTWPAHTCVFWAWLGAQHVPGTVPCKDREGDYCGMEEGREGNSAVSQAELACASQAAEHGPRSLSYRDIYGLHFQDCK